jgi:hypothetical protein
MTKNIVFITAYRDIGRGEWPGWLKRSNDDYIEYFKNLAFNISYKLIVFVERKLIDRLRELNLPNNVELLESENYETIYEKFMQRERQIMNSEDYKVLVPEYRKELPEHWSAEYTLLNHSKISYISHAKRLYPDHDFYSWVDFGLVRSINECPKNLELEGIEKITFAILKNPPRSRISPTEMLKTNDIYFHGCHFIVPSNLVEKYENLYEDKIRQFQDIGVCDDDQNLVFQIYFDHPDLFQTFLSPDWRALFKHFLNRQTILLNMIVKNEAHVIGKTLETLCSKINFDYWVISDTGSTDNTREIIQEFYDKKGIKGELHNDEWRDFGHNRSVALAHAYNKSDFLFIFDADDDLCGKIEIPKKVEFDSYHLRFGGGYTLEYWRTCLINNRKKWKYVGVLHEYITLMDGQGPQTNTNLQGDYYIVHGTTGGRSTDPMKYHKDAAILERGFFDLPESDSLRNRYAFYCANSYKDAGNHDKAIEWYIKTIDLSGWSQEKYRSCILISEIFKHKNEIEKAVYYWIKSTKFDLTRVEGIYKLVQHYCCEGMDYMAFMYYTIIQDWYENVYFKTNQVLGDKLFVDILDYDFMLPYYMIIVSDRVKRNQVGVKMYDMIFTKRKIHGQWFIDNLLFNFQFFVKHVDKSDKGFIERMKSYVELLENSGLKIKESFYHNMYEVING